MFAGEFNRAIQGWICFRCSFLLLWISCHEKLN
jgi:hypothetical protein